MSVTPSNMAMGPGTLYVAEFGTTEPLDSALEDTPSASDWTDVGATSGGLTATFDQNFKALECDQLTWTPESRITANAVTFDTKLAEVTLDNLALAMNGGTVTPGSGYDAYEPDMGGSDNSPDYKAIIFDGFGAGGLRRRIIIRKCLNTKAVAVDSSKEAQTLYQVTFSAHYVSASIKPYKILQATNGS